MANPKVVVVGATGAVGENLLTVLKEREHTFPMASLRLAASPRSVGRVLPFGNSKIRVEEATPDIFDDCDIAFIAANDDVSQVMAQAAKDRECVAIDKSGAWRMKDHVPLVVPEVNSFDLDWHAGIIATPNCSTTPLVMVLDALRQVNPVKRVIAATYQSVSGTGRAAMEELEDQSRDLLGDGEAHPQQYPYQIAFNLLPHIGSFKENGYASEEVKMLEETRKMLHQENLPVSATCVRVPVSVCHSEAVNIELERPMSVSEARELLAGYPGVVVLDDPGKNGYPMPIGVEGSDDVFVGRIREDTALPNGLAMWLVSDNLRKGAATNAVQIAEEVVARGLWGKGHDLWQANVSHPLVAAGV